jgi:hypothetical protein
MNKPEIQAILGKRHRTKKKNPQKTKHRKQKRDEDHGPHLR